MIDGLRLSIPQRMILLRITLIFSLIISIFLSLNLWGGYRTFPYTPILAKPLVIAPFDFILSGLAILGWLCSLFLKKERLFIFLSFVLCLILVLHDLNRLQPWFFIYNSLLAVFIFYNGRVDDPNKFTSVFIIMQLIFASVYFYCGISQLNCNFIESTYAEIINPLKTLMSERQFLFFKKMGVLVPYIFLFIGLGFTISPLRYLAITMAVCIHLLLLIFLFPSQKNTNYTLWFSNLSFIVMLTLLFSGKTKQRYFSPTFLFKMPLFYIVVAVFLMMPAFNVFNRWPDYLSSNFRSGNNSSALIMLNQNVKQKLPYYLRHFCEPRGDVYIFNFGRWSSHELHADCYPERLVFNSIYNSILNSSGCGVKDLQLIVQPKTKLLCKP
ncbi:MAG TPA: hypothetical protein PL029_07965 [Bacteroidia bacterium]|nr:hypothetical protein [Bacteroidia bacterium]